MNVKTDLTQKLQQSLNLTFCQLEIPTQIQIQMQKTPSKMDVAPWENIGLRENWMVWDCIQWFS